MLLKRYWDSCAFLAWLQDEPDTSDACNDTLNEAKSGSFIILTSSLTLTETLWMRKGPKLGKDKADLLNRFFRRSFLRVVNLDRKIAEDAQLLVWDHGIKPKDAIHVATALRYDCDMLQTFDIGLLKKTGLVHGLTICAPESAKQSSLDLRAPREPG